MVLQFQKENVATEIGEAKYNYLQNQINRNHSLNIMKENYKSFVEDPQYYYRQGLTPTDIKKCVALLKREIALIEKD